jgi:glyoxylase I family protein
VSTFLCLHHVSVLVSDTGRALRFYRDLLGLQPDDSRPALDFPGAWLAVGEQQIHLIEIPENMPTGPVVAHGGRDRHFALQVTELEPVRARLEAHGVAFTLSRSGRRALFCHDPDGNAIELLERPAPQ